MIIDQYLNSIYLSSQIAIAEGEIIAMNVHLFPYADRYNEWTKLAQQFSNIVTATVSDFLEIHATDQDKKEGMDIADYLLCHNLNKFKRSL